MSNNPDAFGNNAEILKQLNPATLTQEEAGILIQVPVNDEVWQWTVKHNRQSEYIRSWFYERGRAAEYDEVFRSRGVERPEAPADSGD